MVRWEMARRAETAARNTFDGLVLEMKNLFYRNCVRLAQSGSSLRIHRERVWEGVRFFKWLIGEGQLPGVGTEDIDRLAAGIMSLDRSPATLLPRTIRRMMRVLVRLDAGVPMSPGNRRSVPA